MVISALNSSCRYETSEPWQKKEGRTENHSNHVRKQKGMHSSYPCPFHFPCHETPAETMFSPGQWQASADGKQATARLEEIASDPSQVPDLV